MSLILSGSISLISAAVLVVCERSASWLGPGLRLGLRLGLGLGLGLGLDVAQPVPGAQQAVGAGADHLRAVGAAPARGAHARAVDAQPVRLEAGHRGHAGDECSIIGRVRARVARTW